jgi:hypothetical protein
MTCWSFMAKVEGVVFVAMRLGGEGGGRERMCFWSALLVNWRVFISLREVASGIPQSQRVLRVEACLPSPRVFLRGRERMELMEWRKEAGVWRIHRP